MYQREISLPAELYRRPVENLPPMPPPVRRRKRSRVRRRRKLARFLATCCAMMAVCVLLANAFAAGPEEKAPEPALPRTAPIVPITAEEPIIKDPVDPEAWNLILVNPWNPLPENYSFTKKELSNGHAVDERCYPDLQAMMDACRAAGNSPVICSSYRSYEKQQSLYQNKVNRLAAQGYSQEKAREEAAKAVALPGTSEHQLGLAVDIVDIANQNKDQTGPPFSDGPVLNSSPLRGQETRAGPTSPVLKGEMGGSAYFLSLSTFEKCSLVSWATTGHRTRTPIRLGIAIRPLRVSAISHARDSFMVAPISRKTTKMI